MLKPVNMVHTNTRTPPPSMLCSFTVVVMEMLRRPFIPTLWSDYTLTLTMFTRTHAFTHHLHAQQATLKMVNMVTLHLLINTLELLLRTC